MAKKDKMSGRISHEAHFADPIKIKYEREEDKPVDAKKSPWDFRCPQYDQRSSNFINAGTNYGVGYKNPVGHLSQPKQRVDTMPFDRPETMRVDEKK